MYLQHFFTTINYNYHNQLLLLVHIFKVRKNNGVNNVDITPISSKLMYMYDNLQVSTVD